MHLFEILTSHFLTVLQDMTDLVCLKSNQIFNLLFSFCLLTSVIVAMRSPCTLCCKVKIISHSLLSFWVEYHSVCFQILIILLLSYVLISMLHSISIDNTPVHYLSFAKIYILVLSFCLYYLFLEGGNHRLFTLVLCM